MLIKEVEKNFLLKGEVIIYFEKKLLYILCYFLLKYVIAHHYN